MSKEPEDIFQQAYRKQVELGNQIRRKNAAFIHAVGKGDMRRANEMRGKVQALMAEARDQHRGVKAHAESQMAQAGVFQLRQDAIGDLQVRQVIKEVRNVHAHEFAA